MKNRTLLVCLECGRELFNRRPNAKYCTVCSDKRRKKSRVCVHCGSYFAPHQLSISKIYLLCSWECLQTFKKNKEYEDAVKKEAEALRTPPNPEGSGIRAGERL